MYVTGSVLLPFFSLMTMLIAVPTGVKIFNWIGTMWRGSVTFETPMLWAIGFLITFTFGGLTGVILASPPLDFHVSDTYFVVAHFHYVVFGTVVFAMFSGFYFWWPKWTGKMLNERLGKIHFWLLFIGFHTTFLDPALDRRHRHAASLRELPAEDGFTWMNQLSTVGRHDPRRLDAAVPPQRLHHRPPRARKVTVDDPWGYGALARVGDLLPAAAAQLHVDPAHPLGVAGVRPAPPGGGRAGRHRAAEGRTRRARRRPGRRRGEVAMRANTNLFWILGGFFWLADVVYIIWSLDRLRVTVRSSGSAPSGMALSRHPARSSSPSTWGELHARPGRASCPRTGRRQHRRRRPRDGHFSPWSWWPFTARVRRWR